MSPQNTSSSSSGLTIVSGVAEAIVKTGLSQIPVIGGLLGNLLGVFWPSGNSNSPEAIWNSISSQVNADITQRLDQALTGKTLSFLTTKLKGLQVPMRNFTTTAPDDFVSLNTYFGAARDFFGSNIVFFTTGNIPADELQAGCTSPSDLTLLPMYTLLANMHLMLLRDGLLFGSSNMAWPASTYLNNLCAFRQQLATYSQHVTQTLQTARAQFVNPDGSLDVVSWAKSQNLLVQSVLSYVATWPYLDATQYQGVLQVPGTSAQLFAGQMVPQLHPFAPTQLDIYAPGYLLPSRPVPPISSLVFTKHKASFLGEFSALQVSNGTYLPPSIPPSDARFFLEETLLSVTVAPANPIVSVTIGYDIEQTLGSFILSNSNLPVPVTPTYCSDVLNWAFTMQDGTVQSVTTSPGATQHATIAVAATPPTATQPAAYQLASIVPDAAAYASFLFGFRQPDSYLPAPLPGTAQPFMWGTYSNNGDSVTTMELVLTQDSNGVPCGGLTLTPPMPLPNNQPFAATYVRDLSYDGTTLRGTTDNNFKLEFYVLEGGLLSGSLVQSTANSKLELTLNMTLTAVAPEGLVGTYLGTMPSVSGQPVEFCFIIQQPLPGSPGQSSFPLAGSAAIYGTPPTGAQAGSSPPVSTIPPTPQIPMPEGNLTVTQEGSAYTFICIDEYQNRWNWTGEFSPAPGGLQFGLLQAGSAASSGNNTGNWQLRKLVQTGNLLLPAVPPPTASPSPAGAH